MKRVLLTGGTGFVGNCAIAPLLEKGYEVHAVTSKSKLPESNKNLIWHQANLLDPIETEDLLKIVQPTDLLHFAWYVEHGKFWNAVENVDWLKASIHLVQKFVEYGGKRVVTAGTLSEYEVSEHELLSEENTGLDPHSLYAATKVALYQTLEKYAKAAGFSFAWGRVFFMFGRNEAPARLVPSVIRTFLNNEIAKTSHGNQMRDFMSTEEIASAFVALLESEVQGAVNIASGEPRTIKELVLEIANLMEKQEDQIAFGAFQSPPNEPQYIVADVTKLRDAVKWKPSRDFSESLQQTINWWKENS
jgi:nucleoside-diphosphate-sugar epimerase